MKEGTARAHDDSLGLARRGMLFCRRGDWTEGMELLGRVVETTDEVGLPGNVYSFLGYGLARQHLKYRQGLALCEYALRAQPGEPENYLNMARILLLMNRRHKALGVLNRGLALAPDHPVLQETRLSLGVRRSPVLAFLERSNFVNRLLGRLRNRFRDA